MSIRTTMMITMFAAAAALSVSSGAYAVFNAYTPQGVVITETGPVTCGWEYDGMSSDCYYAGENCWVQVCDMDVEYMKMTGTFHGASPDDAAPGDAYLSCKVLQFLSNDAADPQFSTESVAGLYCQGADGLGKTFSCEAVSVQGSAMFQPLLSASPEAKVTVMAQPSTNGEGWPNRCVQVDVERDSRSN